jgi:hypothetical protein
MVFLVTCRACDGGGALIREAMEICPTGPESLLPKSPIIVIPSLLKALKSRG